MGQKLGNCFTVCKGRSNLPRAPALCLLPILIQKKKKGCCSESVSERNLPGVSHKHQLVSLLSKLRYQLKNFVTFFFLYFWQCVTLFCIFIALLRYSALLHLYVNVLNYLYILPSNKASHRRAVGNNMALCYCQLGNLEARHSCSAQIGMSQSTDPGHAEGSRVYFHQVALPDVLISKTGGLSGRSLFWGLTLVKKLPASSLVEPLIAQLSSSVLVLAVSEAAGETSGRE